MFKSFILDNLVSVWMKIINSVVVVGLYYGFLTTFSMGPSYLFLLRARVLEKGTEKKVSATTGFLTGQLIMFISIYYEPLYRALDRPHTITIIALPYLLFQLFLGNSNNHKYFWNDESIRKKTLMRNLSIQMIFVNNLLFQLVNLFTLPSAILVRLINIYMFRSNNKILFLTSSFVGWLIGQILFLKWLGFLVDWIQKNPSIKSNPFFRSNKYILSKWRHYVSRIYFYLLFTILLIYTGRIPCPLFTFFKEMKEISDPEEEKESGQIEKQQEQEISAEEDLSPYPFSEEKEDSYEIDETEKNAILRIEKPLVITLFDYKRWNRPLRYIKNDRFENAVRNEMSQYFFYTYQSDGKERISFTYPPSLSTFVEMMQKKMSLFTTEKISYDELYNCWNSTNEQKKNNLSKKLLNRSETIDNKFSSLDGLEKKSRLSNDKTKKKCLPSMYDPFLNGSYRGQIKNEIYKKNDIWINLNKIYGIFLNINTNYPEFEQIIIDSEEKQNNFDKIVTDLEDKTIVNGKKSIGIKEISKKVPRWSYELIDEIDEVEGEIEKEEEENVATVEDHEIRSRKAKRVVVFSEFSNSDNSQKDNTKDPDNTDEPDQEEFALLRYSIQSDFRRDIIKGGSMRPQRRKTVTWKLFQTSVHSPLFLDKIGNWFFDILDILEPVKFLIFKNWMWKNTEFQIADYTEENTKENEKEEEQKRKKKEAEEQVRLEIAEAWDTNLFAQPVRGCLLVTHSIIRKYILFPLLIITKNIVRMLLFQIPEWSEDFKDLEREMHIKCTYNGVQLSETEFPRNWLTDGIQIKILFPFRLKPWHKSKLRSPKKHPMKKKTKKMDFRFLTIWGTETDIPFGPAYSPNIRSFFDPIFKELRKKIKKWRNNFFVVLKMLNERKKAFRNVSKETKKWIIKKILFVQEIIKKFQKVFLFGFRQIYELSETQKDSTIPNSNQMIYESSIPIQSINWTNYSSTEKKRKDLNDRTKIIIKEIEKITNEKKGGFILPEINVSSNKATYNNKRLDLQKNIWQLLKRIKRGNVRLVRKSHYFFQLLIERAYIDIFLYIINIHRINIQLFLESTNKKINKYISNNEANKERIHKTNQSIIPFISTIKKSISNIRTTNSQIFFDVSSLSQAYVFYKLSQTLDLNLYKYKFKSVFEYDGTSLFLKNEIKDCLIGIKGIFHSKLIHPSNSVMNQWVNWLKGHYQYDLSQNRWSRLVPKKWRNRINERGMAQNKDLIKCDSYEKNRFIFSKKQEVDSFLKKKKLKKQYEYDLLSYKSINYADKKDSYIYGYRSLLQSKNNQEIYSNTRKQKLFAMTDDISIKNYLDDIIYVEKTKNMDRKYFDWRIMNFCQTNKMDMETWVDKDYYLTPHEEINLSNQKKMFFDWMGMNVEIINDSISMCVSISNLKLWFFPKFVIFYNAYTSSDPWVIPIKLLFFNLNGNINKKISENKSITKKNELELETRNQREKEYKEKVDLESSLSIQEKDFEQDSVGWNMKKGGRKQKKSKNKIDTELNLFLRRYWRFQLNWTDDSLDEKILNNINVYCLLLRLTNPTEISLAYVQRGELSLNIMTIPNEENLKLMKNGILFIEPVRLFRQNDGKFIMYQTIGPSLIHKSKDQISQNKREREKSDIKNFDESISKHHKMTENKEKKHYDLLVPENILSSRRRRELRILICFTYRNRNTSFYNENKVNNCYQALAKSKDRKKKKLMNFKFFLWPNYRLEDLACMNRYWFDTNNGSRFNMVRIHMYPRLKIR
uniref:Protein TIC 214 n=1 Tax=Bauhinia variegata var. variegata TaxID=2811339 RepID=A0A891ZL57_BAUVA|nr:hypothetical protein RF1 [Bauhinia variegata var. variegata]